MFEDYRYFTFAQLLRSYRIRDEEMSQERLGNLIHVHRNTISAWERGDYLPQHPESIDLLETELHLSESEVDLLRYKADFPLRYDTFSPKHNRAVTEDVTNPLPLALQSTSTNININIGSGTYVIGDMSTGGGDFAGRDKVASQGTGSTLRKPLLQRPRPVQYFTGREKEIEQILEDLQPERVITLVGPGGIGKTAIAIQVIQRLAPGDEPPKSFPDGIIFYKFEKDRGKADDALEHIARSFGEEPKPTSASAAQRALSSRRVLLVLDGAENTAELNKILTVCGGCGALITSRRKEDSISLHYRHIIKSLSFENSVKLIREWQGANVDNEEIVKRICKLLDGVPLALCLAGSYLTHHKMNILVYVSWLEENLMTALDQGNQEGDEHKSIPLLIQHSLEAVSESAKQALAIAGVLSSQPFSLNIIVAALGSSPRETYQALGALMNYSFLDMMENNYQVTHALIYTYARECIGLREDIFKRLVNYYIQRNKEQSERDPDWRDSFTEISYKESTHQMAVLDACMRQKMWTEVLNLSNTMMNLAGGLREDDITVSQNGLMAARILENRWSEGRWLANLGLSYHAELMMEQAIETYQYALGILQETGDQEGEGYVLYGLGDVYEDLEQIKYGIQHHDRSLEENYCFFLIRGGYHLRRYEDAINAYQSALLISRRLDHLRTENILYNLEDTYENWQPIEKAIQYYRRSLVIFQNLDDFASEGKILCNLGHCYKNLRRVEQAIKYYHQSIAALEMPTSINKSHFQSFFTPRVERSTLLERLYEAYNQLCKIHPFKEFYLEVLSVYQETNNSNILYLLGEAFRLGITECIMEIYLHALVFYRKINDPESEKQVLLWLGNLSIDLGQIENAIEFYQQALKLSQELENEKSNVQVVIWGCAAEIYIAMERYQKAIELYKKCIELDPANPSIHTVLATVYLKLGQIDDAVSHYKRRVELSPSNAFFAYIGLGIITLKQRKNADAWHFFEVALSVWRKTLKDGQLSLSGLLANKALAHLVLGQEEVAINTLKEALARHQPDDIKNIFWYQLLADTPELLKGLSHMLELIDEALF